MIIPICEMPSVSHLTDAYDVNYMSTNSMQLRIYRNRCIECSIKVPNNDNLTLDHNESKKKSKYFLEIYILR